ELLYATTFDANTQEWDQRTEGQDHFQVIDHSLVLSIDEGAFSLLDHRFSDFDLRVNATRLAQADDSNEMGVLFRVQDRRNSQDPLNYYMFRIRGDGAYRVEVCHPCDPSSPHPDVMSEWQISPAILTGLNQVNQIRIVAKDDHFQFYVNDQRLT